MGKSTMRELEEKIEKLVKKPITYGILKPEEYIDGGIPMLRIQDIQSGIVNTKSLHLVSSGLSNQYKRTILEGGEIIISLVGTIGLTAVVPLELKGANLHRNLGLIDFSERVHSYYAVALMKQPAFLHIIRAITKGGIQKLLNLGDLSQIYIPIPPIELQREFAKRVEKVEALKAKLKASQLQAEEQFKALSQRAFAGEL